jgi:very-short-patch-repair endonuclease
MPPLPSPREAAGRGRGWGADLGKHKTDSRVPRARNLRRDMTIAERKLWWHLRRVAPARSHLRRQATIGPYYADFACHQLRLVIELDGGQHGHTDRVTADAARTDFLTARGYRVLRFWNNDVLSNIEGVLTVIQSALNEAVGSRPPPPTPPRHASRGRRGQPAAQSGSQTTIATAAQSTTSSNDAYSGPNVRDAERCGSPPPAKRRGGVGGGGS